MILYLVYDNVKKTLSMPLIADSKEQLDLAMMELNPENLKDLRYIHIGDFQNPEELLNLRFTTTPTVSGANEKSPKDTPDQNSQSPIIKIRDTLKNYLNFTPSEEKTENTENQQQ